MLLQTLQRIRQLVDVGKSRLALSIGIALIIAGCSLPQVSAESRLFLNLSLEKVAEFSLPQTEFNGTIVGGFTALTYDRNRDRLYALVNDPGQPRFYTFTLNPQESSLVALESVTPFVDPLLDATTPIAATHQGLALTRNDTVFVVSEGNAKDGIAPRLSEFQRDSGEWQQDLPLPKQYFSLQADGTVDLGVLPRNGLGALAISADGDRLYAATQGPLLQDDVPNETGSRYSRFLHYWIGEPEPILVAEYLYPLTDPQSTEASSHLSEILPVDGAGHFLSLERSTGTGDSDHTALYQIATGIAADTSRLRTLPNGAKGLTPILKQSLLNLADLQVPAQDIAGMVLGPYLADGTQSVLLVSNNHFQANTPTQWTLLRLVRHRQSTSS